MNDQDGLLDEMRRIAARNELSQRERQELVRLRAEKRMAESMNPSLPPAVEVVMGPRRLGPLTLTSGGIQYQVDLTLKQ
jgi:hypothetical protein